MFFFYWMLLYGIAYSPKLFHVSPYGNGSLWKRLDNGFSYQKCWVTFWGLGNNSQFSIGL